MSRARTRRKPSLFRRIAYFLMLVSGGGAGVGGWLLKDHPRVQALLAIVTGKPLANELRNDSADPVAEVVDLLEPAASFTQPGTYRVKIRQVHLDPNLFQAGHTVDIQAKVLRRDEQGHTTTVWDTASYGERLAVAGRDELIAGWDHRPFEVAWSPGDRLTVEVYDRHTGLFAQPKRFFLADPESAPREFPLRPGTFPLQPEARKEDPRVDPRNVTIVLESQRVGGLNATATATVGDRAASRDASASDDSPIVIK
ncbi:MAG: hypothetical protein ACYC61_01125 [Isosphaeraceae bacterium]